MQLKQLACPDVAIDTPGNHHSARMNFSEHFGTFPYDERALGGNLSFKTTVDADLPFENERAREGAPFSQQRVHIVRPYGGRIRLL